jgi:transposase InsO family protein
MTIQIPKDIQEERLRWIMPIIKKELKIVQVLLTCPHSERSLKRWLSAFRKFGKEGLIPKSTRPKAHPKRTSPEIENRILSKRKENNLCALKLHWQLDKQGLRVPISTIGKVLKRENLVRTYRKAKVKYKYIKQERQPGELVEIDVKLISHSVKGKKLVQYTAIDTASRWRHLKIYEEQSSFNSIEFLKDLKQRFPYEIQAIKTDNGSVFTNYYLGTTKRSNMTVKNIHALDIFCQENKIAHYLIDAGKPEQNGKVERSHREDNEKLYDVQTFKSFKQLEYKVRLWNNYYNNLEHCSLAGKTPNDVLQLRVPDVCV